MPAKPFVNKQGGFTVFLKLHTDILSLQSLSVVLQNHNFINYVSKCSC